MSSQGSQAPESASALEQFRQQWREEVNARSKQAKKPVSTQSSTRRRESFTKPERPINKPPTQHSLADASDAEHAGEEASPRSALIEKIEGLRIKEVDEDDFSAAKSTKEPSSALEHYERAVEKESQGSLGDSLSHYRQAYRLDAKVDQTYKKKHFPAQPKPADVIPSNAPATVPEIAPHNSSKQPNAPLPFPELIASYANEPIPNAQPIIEGDIMPPCPIKDLPTEVLIELLQHVADHDPAVFVRLALVCKRLAYYVFTDSGIWKKVALGSHFGLASQQYQFATDLQGREAIFETLEDNEEEAEDKLPPVTDALFPIATDWREIFHNHPRIRFSGVYISTVNYTRPGGVSTTPGAWTSSVHIVTYYRYLRFFRDGTVISLLTVNDPFEVVHHLTKENIALARAKGSNHPLGSISHAAATIPPPKDGEKPTVSAQNLMRHALRGRWRLCHPSITDPASGMEVGANVGVAGDLHIETEGAGPRYMYTMHLALKSGSRSKHTTKNNKLVWKGFWNYNNLTADWSEFTMRIDKAFYFTRVRSYGLGY